MQPAEQIIVLAVTPGKESREIVEADSFQAFHALEAFECTHLLRADAVDKNLVQFASVAPCRDRESEHIPERKAEIIDQDLATCVLLALGCRSPWQLHVRLMPMRYFERAGWPRGGEATWWGFLGLLLIVFVEILLSGILGHLHKVFFGASAHCGDGIECCCH
jgi:hypothetical protein